MDLVYICREGDNEELRYSIRSAVENLPHDNIWVVGGKPSWYTGNHIAVRQSGAKYSNARNNMRAIVESSDISDDFILMNDDFFIIKSINEVPVFHGGLLKNKIKYLRKKYGSSSYISLLSKTMRFLKTQRISNPLDYALHIPFKMNKKLLSNIINIDVSWRIAYGNLYGIGGEHVQIQDGSSYDVKVYTDREGQLSDIPINTMTDIFLSTEDNSFEFMQPMLDAMFPNKTRYEK